MPKELGAVNSLLLLQCSYSNLSLERFSRSIISTRPKIGKIAEVTQEKRTHTVKKNHKSASMCIMMHLAIPESIEHASAHPHLAQK